MLLGAGVAVTDDRIHVLAVDQPHFVTTASPAYRPDP
jgi:hypothetical protein